MARIIQEESEFGGRALVAESEEDLNRFELNSFQSTIVHQMQMQEAQISLIMSLDLDPVAQE